MKFFMSCECRHHIKGLLFVGNHFKDQCLILFEGGMRFEELFNGVMDCKEHVLIFSHLGVMTRETKISQ